MLRPRASPLGFRKPRVSAARHPEAQVLCVRQGLSPASPLVKSTPRCKTSPNQARKLSPQALRFELLMRDTPADDQRPCTLRGQTYLKRRTKVPSALLGILRPIAAGQSRRHTCRRKPPPPPEARLRHRTHLQGLPGSRDPRVEDSGRCFRVPCLRPGLSL